MTCIRPSDDALQEPFWRGLATGKLVIQKCVDCARFQHPPTPVCRECQGFNLSWREVSGRARLISYTTVHHPVHPLLNSWVPYNVALVQLEEGPRLVTSVAISADQTVRVGMSLTCEVREIADDFSLPFFLPTD